MSLGLPARGGGETLVGSGATFPNLLYQKWFNVFGDETSIKVNYQAIGSGRGIQQLFDQAVDFAGTDAFVDQNDLAKVPSRILHLPTCLGAVVITYNLPGSPTLKLTPQLISDIFLGKITRWNDPRIVKVNPDVQFPELKITVIHRSDSSGTTFILSDYLSKVNKEWKDSVGRGKELNWPVGLGVERNGDIAGQIDRTSGGIGYVEMTYASQNRKPMAQIQNRSGNYISPNLESIHLAASNDLPDDTRISITDTSVKDGYPISSFSWVIFYQEQDICNHSRSRAQALHQLLWWMIHEGQSFNNDLLYGNLPHLTVKRAEMIIKSMTFHGQPLQP